MKTQNLVRVGIMASMIAVGAFIRVPAPVVGAFTLQLTFVILAGILLGAKYGALSSGVYAIGGLIGIPWFTAGGGPGYIFQPTFGFILSFVIGGYIAGWFMEFALKHKKDNKKININYVISGSVLSTIVVWVIGMLYLSFIYQVYLGKDFGYGVALISIFSLPLVLDIILALVVSVVGVRIHSGIGYRERAKVR